MSDDANIEALDGARRMLQNRRPAEAEARLRALLERDPDMAEAWRVLAAALSLQGRMNEGVDALRRALALEPDNAAQLVNLAEVLITLGRAQDAVDLLAPRITDPDVRLGVLTSHAGALKALGRADEAVAAYEHAAKIRPEGGIAEHNLAAALGDLHRLAECLAASDRAEAQGLNAPELWMVRARAFQGLGDLDRAVQAFEEVLRRRPANPNALGELSQLIWMRTADAAAALAPLDQAIRDFPRVPAIRLKRARLLESAGAGGTAAYEGLLSGGSGLESDAIIQARAAELSAPFLPTRALEHARRAMALAPEEPMVLAALAQAQLAAGDPEGAARAAQTMHELAPLNQFAIALQATAWRLMGDPRYRALHDYDAMVGVSEIDTPDGWPTLTAYLADLAAALERLHPFRTHPVGQSVRHGSQTQQNLSYATDPAIKAFAQAIDGPIRRYVDGLGAGDDPLRRRRSAGYGFAGIWSVLLRPGGFHANHMHPEGWLSSACYIALPAAIEQDHQGWLQFGQPGPTTKPPLEAEYFVKPRPGRLVLFPSYMWHGTVPFEGDEPRLSIAFDVVPS